MKKEQNVYKYNYIWEIIAYLLLFGCALAYIYYRNFIRVGGIRHLHTDLMFSCGMLAMAVSNHFKFFHYRSVVFEETYVQFNSMFMKKLKKVVPSMNVRYESFSEIKATRFPLIGIFEMRLKADGIPGDILIRWTFWRYGEMYDLLYEKIKEGNPNIIIDHRLEQYMNQRLLNRKKQKERNQK
ncbi:MAG: hypothetical protein IK080_11585 [Clostridia bacterium]|nr:hypothetical protein [Clostridia bacterium]